MAQYPPSYPSQYPPSSEGYPAPQQPGGYMPPQVPGSYPAIQIPPEIAMQATSYQLGTLTQVYTANLVKLVFSVAILFALTALNISFAIADPKSFLVLLIVLAATVYAIYYFITNYNIKTYIFSEGLVHAKGNALEVARWEHIEAVWQKVIRYRYRGLIPIYTTYNYTIRRNDGAQFKFSSAIKNIKQLGEALQQEVTRRQLPKATAAYNSGAPVNFGPYSVSTQGLSKSGVALSWNQVGRVELKRGWVIVHKQGSLLAFGRNRAATIPNLQVFLSLIDYARGRMNSGY